LVLFISSITDKACNCSSNSSLILVDHNSIDKLFTETLFVFVVFGLLLHKNYGLGGRVETFIFVIIFLIIIRVVFFGSPLCCVCGSVALQYLKVIEKDFMWFIAVVSLLFFATIVSSLTSPDQVNALYSLYNQTDGENWHFKIEPWNFTHPHDPCAEKWEVNIYSI
jgi:hypothetical protein